MRGRLILWLGVFIACFSIRGYGQNITRSCSTDLIYLQQLQENKSFQQARAVINNHTKSFHGQGLRRAEINIPVVIHILYNTDAQNISDAQVQAQIDILNKDFGEIQSNKYPEAAASKIRFRLATADPSGHRTNGITRTFTSLTKFPIGPVVMSTVYGGKSPWPSQDYLNIWVANVSGVLGFAFMPGDTRDGVVINYKYFGPNASYNPFDLGRTVTHEVGHWLNLFHTWGLSTGCEADDEVEDTPNSAQPNYGCKIDHASCSVIDMVENYMDYSDDACMNLFTQGQVSRMESLFAPGGYRASIVHSAGLSEGIIAHCFDGIQNEGETGIDCGGECTPCPVVALNTCNDGIQNGTETGIDCGGDCAPCPCKGVGLFSMFDYIEEVSINDSTLNSGDNHGYASFPNKHFPLFTNRVNTLLLKPAPIDYLSQQHWSVWIDWNKNGVFENDQEWVYHVQKIGDISDTLSIQKIHSSFKLKALDTFDMRVQMQWSLPVSACDTFDFGETEDYKVIVQEAILVDQCLNGIQDPGENGIDCGPYCKPCQINYCISTGKISKYEFIDRVQIGDQIMQSGNNNGYSLHQGSPLEAYAGQVINITLTAGFAGNYVLSENWYVWADWNQDGDFEDKDEFILQQSGALPVHYTMTVPAWVSVGTIRLRIQMRDSKKANACEVFGFGEVEDYDLVIHTSSSRLDHDIKIHRVTTFPNPVNEVLNIRLGQSDKITIQVINDLGQIMYTCVSPDHDRSLYTLDCRNIHPGIYTLILKGSDWKENKRILITH